MLIYFYPKYELNYYIPNRESVTMKIFNVH